MIQSINNLSDLDAGDRAYDQAKDQKASNAWDDLCEFTDNLVMADPAERLEMIIAQPNYVGEAIKVLGWRAGMTKDMVNF